MTIPHLKKGDTYFHLDLPKNYTVKTSYLHYGVNHPECLFYSMIEKSDIKTLDCPITEFLFQEITLLHDFNQYRIYLLSFDRIGQATLLCPNLPAHFFDIETHFWVILIDKTCEMTFHGQSFQFMINRINYDSQYATLQYNLKFRLLIKYNLESQWTDPDINRIYIMISAFLIFFVLSIILFSIIYVWKKKVSLESTPVPLETRETLI